MNKLVKIIIPVLVILGLILAAGCSKQSSVSTSSWAGAVPAPSAPMESFRSTAYDASSNIAMGESGGTEIDRKIVKNGYMTLEVNDITAAITGVAAMAEDLNGYVVSSNKSGDKDATYGQITIRVPSGSFDIAFDRLRHLAVNVPNESTTSEDVTEQYTDLQAQLRNYEATEAQYLELLKKADKVEDMLAVQRELSNVRGQIEQVKGRIQYIERTSDMALISVDLQKVKPIGGTAW
ncbi:MAG: hypothetical protein A2Z75_01870, partial [Chloroflexi bacterium RBG_13_50_10]